MTDVKNNTRQTLDFIKMKNGKAVIDEKTGEAETFAIKPGETVKNAALDLESPQVQGAIRSGSITVDKEAEAKVEKAAVKANAVPAA